MKSSAEFEKAKRAHDLANAGVFASLSARARNILDRAGIKSVAELASKSDFDLFSIRSCGKGTLAELRAFQHKHPVIERPILDASALISEIGHNGIGIDPTKTMYPPPRNPAGELHVGANDRGEVVINLPHDMTGHICFTPHQARHLAVVLLRQAAAASGEPLP